MRRLPAAVLSAVSVCALVTITSAQNLELQLPDLSTLAAQRQAMAAATAAMQRAIADARRGTTILITLNSGLIVPVDRAQLQRALTAQVEAGVVTDAAASQMVQRVTSLSPATVARVEQQAVALDRASAATAGGATQQTTMRACDPPARTNIADGVEAALTLRSGACVSGVLVDFGNAFTMRVNGTDRRIPRGDVAVIDFTSGGSTAAAPAPGGHLTVLRSGQELRGELYDISERRPLRITLNMFDGQRDLSSDDVDRIVLWPLGSGETAPPPATPPSQVPTTPGVGCADLSGRWVQQTSGIGTSTWTLTHRGDGTYTAIESGLGAMSGIATYDGQRLRISATAAGLGITYDWALGSACGSGQGELRFTGSRTDRHASAVRREGADGGSQAPMPDSACADLSGRWVQQTSNIGASTWILTSRGDGTYTAVESGLGSVAGIAAYDGQRLRIDARGVDLGITYEWLLDAGCGSGRGELRFTGARSDRHPSAVRREDAGLVAQAAVSQPRFTLAAWTGGRSPAPRRAGRVASTTQTRWSHAQRRDELRAMLQGIDDGSTLYVEDGGILVPVSRELLVFAITFSTLAPLTHDRPLALGDYEIDVARQMARDAVIATRALRARIVADIEVLDGILGTAPTAGLPVFDPRHVGEVNTHLRAEWWLNADFTNAPLEYQHLKGLLSPVRLVISRADCAPQPPFLVRCSMTGSLILTRTAQNTILELQGASFEVRDGTGGTLRFHVYLPEASGHILYEATIRGKTGTIEQGSVFRGRNNSAVKFGTFEGARQRPIPL